MRVPPNSSIHVLLDRLRDEQPRGLHPATLNYTIAQSAGRWRHQPGGTAAYVRPNGLKASKHIGPSLGKGAVHAFAWCQPLYDYVADVLAGLRSPKRKSRPSGSVPSQQA